MRYIVSFSIGEGTAQIHTTAEDTIQAVFKAGQILGRNYRPRKIGESAPTSYKFVSVTRRD